MFSPNSTRVMKSRKKLWVGHVARMEVRRGTNKVLIGKIEGQRTLGRPKHRWVDNNKKGLQDVVQDMDWIGLAQDRDRWTSLVNAVMNIRVK